MLAIGVRLFGSETRTRVLMDLAALGESYPRGVATLVQKPLASVQRILADLEDQGVLQSRLRGTVRLTTFTDNRVALDLKTLLYEMIERDKSLSARPAKKSAPPPFSGQGVMIEHRAPLIAVATIVAETLWSA